MALATMPASVMDWWLLKQFPGRTLEEIDTIDMARYWRAVQVKRLMEVEEMRSLALHGKYKPNSEEWRLIARNDALVALE